MLRVGIYGGTFSPPHAGHIAAARAFMEEMWLDVLYVIPAAIPPHKEMEYPVSGAHRLEMCRLAFSEVEGVIVSDLELSRKGKSYTVDTLRALFGEDRRLFLLCGTDMMLTFDEWREPEEIFRLCYPVYIRRENNGALDAEIIEKNTHYKEAYGKTVIKLIHEPIELSSSEVRRDIKNGASVEGKIHPLVEKYIRDNHLYV